MRRIAYGRAMSRSVFTRPLPAIALALASPAALAATLPGISYDVLASGPAAGAHPTRADSAAIRYIGRFEDGQVFSTSPGDGKAVSTFGVKEVLPGTIPAL